MGRRCNRTCAFSILGQDVRTLGFHRLPFSIILVCMIQACIGTAQKRQQSNSTSGVDRISADPGPRLN